MPSISINTNLSSLIAQQSLKQSSNKLNLAVERMSTGFKINHAKDNAANYSISTNMTTKIGAYQVAEDNVAMGLDLLSTANGSLDQISDKLSRLRALAEQSANGTYGAQSRSAINAEANALVDEIERLYNTTEYNGIAVFKGSSGQNSPITYSTFATRQAGVFLNEINKVDTTDFISLADISDSATVSSGEYTISNARELEKLETMVNNGQVSGGTFVLVDDIDMSECSDWVGIGLNVDGTGLDETVSFTGTFNGNGYTIRNLDLVTDFNNGRGEALFGIVKNAVVKNINIENATLTSEQSSPSSILAFICDNSSITNCSITGTIDATESYGMGTFVVQCENNSIIDSCYADVDINVENMAYFVGGIFGVMENSTVKNSTSEGRITLSDNSNTAAYVGGIGGYAITSTIENCLSTVVIEAENYNAAALGGFVSHISGSTVNSCTYLGSITSSTNQTANANYVAGIGLTFDGSTINNCYVDSNLTATGGELQIGVFSAGDGGGIIKNSSYNPNSSVGVDVVPASVSSNFTISNITQSTTPTTSIDNLYPSYSGLGAGDGTNNFLDSGIINLQVGISGGNSSNINLSLSFKLENLNSFRNIGAGNDDYLSKVDILINSISAKAVEFGAAQNRLESALDEISTQYENLVSSRSTLRDADISEVSSEYIRQQILQEASATLLATANQSPSIALQLI